MNWSELFTVVGLIINLAGSYCMLTNSVIWQHGADRNFKGLARLFLTFEVSIPAWVGPLCMVIGFALQYWARFFR